MTRQLVRLAGQAVRIPLALALDVVLGKPEDLEHRDTSPCPRCLERDRVDAAAARTVLRGLTNAVMRELGHHDVARDGW